VPLLSVVRDPKLRENLRSVALDAQANLVAERGLLAEAQVLEILADLMAGTDRAVITVGDVTAGLIERYGPEYDRPITNRWVGGILRRRLNLQTYKSHGVYVVPMTERTKVEMLCTRYGIDSMAEGATAVQSGDVGTSGTL
jgi:hypothetical protein